MTPRCSRRLSDLITLFLGPLCRWTVFGAAIVFAATAGAGESDSVVTLDQKAALSASQAMIGTTPGDFAFLDREGRPVRLSQYRGKPLLVSFIYTGCFQVCPLTT